MQGGKGWQARWRVALNDVLLEFIDPLGNFVGGILVLVGAAVLRRLLQARKHCGSQILPARTEGSQHHGTVHHHRRRTPC
jgi:Na+-transporting NADH:ubiquinone oxidoreductase subunit NqrD